LNLVMREARGRLRRHAQPYWMRYFKI